MLILNIGLVTSLNHFKKGSFPQGVYLEKSEVIEQLEQHGLAIQWIKEAVSETEKTLIIGIDKACGMTEGVKFLINKVANQLQQDCVAVFDTVRGRGYLIGDYADDWGGEFNPAYFLLG